MSQLNTVQENNSHFVSHLMQGCLFIIFGTAALFLPQLAVTTLELTLGGMLATAGIIAGIINFKSHNHWWLYIPAALTLSIGAILLFKPIVGLVALSLFICVFLVVKGIAEIILAFRYRYLKNWVWLLISGVIALSLAFIAGLGFPEIGILLLGIIIGVNMISYGIAMLMLAWSQQRQDSI